MIRDAGDGATAQIAGRHRLRVRDNAVMGAAGIRRRKKHHKLPEPEVLPPGDADRVFGRFTWGAYSPAGNLERNGFFWRQLRRRRGRDPWTIVGYVLWVLFAAVLAIAVIGSAVTLFR